MIKRKKKTCVSCGHEREIFSKGECLPCSKIRYARRAQDKVSQRVSKPLSRQSYGKIPPRKRKALKSQIWLSEHWGFKSQVDLFEHIWAVSPHKCRFTGEDLKRYRGTKMENNCCAHLLRKGTYSLFKLNPENVVLAYPEFHRIVDQGTSDDRRKHPQWNFALWDQMVEHMKKEYEEFKREYLL
jgi:hypothetical protein